VTFTAAKVETLMAELIKVTRDLNLHVPPSYFQSRTTWMPYEEALAPVVAADVGPLHLYVGVPLCEEHCRFCMYFYGLTDAAGTGAEACVISLEEFLVAIAPHVERPAAGMYVGGGTPTVLNPDQIRRLLHAVGSTFDFEPNSQQTFEMSPRSFTRAKAQAIVDGGVRRVSFGVQSFDPEPVRRAGRRYVGPDQIAQVLDDCRSVGVEEINADLMVGLDGESPESLSSSVERLLDIGCPTISIYRYRQARKIELDERGGLDAYVSSCSDRVMRAIDIAQRYGREVSGRPDGEHIRLVAPGGCTWPDRNLYETRFRPELGNSLAGIGSGGRSFMRNRRLLHCEHRAAAGFGLLGRLIEVEECDEESRVSAALVNALFRDLAVDLDQLTSTDGVDPIVHFGDQFAYLVDAGVLVEQGRRLVVATDHRDDWVYWDKLLYPYSWLRRRQQSHRLRVR
jgi:oxygen-independent coproporphyrinogen-3 oxidase